MKYFLYLLNLLLVLIVYFTSNGCIKQKCPIPVIKSKTPGNGLKKIAFQPDAEEGKDALLFYISKQTTRHGATNSSNYGTERGFVAMESTFEGNNGGTYGLIQFDLTAIPQDAKVVSAKLSLFACPDCSQYIGNTYGHYNVDGNEAVIERVTSPWDENSVTWNTRPSVWNDSSNLKMQLVGPIDSNDLGPPSSYISNGKIILPSSSSNFQDYKNIDVTSLVKDMVKNPATNYGFFFSMKNPTFYRSMVFASSDHSDVSRHPKLTVEYE